MSVLETSVASGSFDDIIKLWDAVTGKEQNTVSSLSHASLNKPSPQLSLRDDWVSFAGERLLWLPSEYRGLACVATKGGLLVLGYNYGEIIIVRFC